MDNWEFRLYCKMNDKEEMGEFIIRNIKIFKEKHGDYPKVVKMRGKPEKLHYVTGTIDGIENLKILIEEDKTVQDKHIALYRKSP